MESNLIPKTDGQSPFQATPAPAQAEPREAGADPEDTYKKPAWLNKLKVSVADRPVLAPAVDAKDDAPRHPATPKGTGFTMGEDAYHANGTFLGKGGFGVVNMYKGDTKGAEVAVKAGSKPDEEAAMYRKAGTHPNIAACHGVANLPTSGLVTEPLGPSVTAMQEKLFAKKTAGELSDAEYWAGVQHLTKGTLNGIAHLASKNVIHRDIKGDNVLLDEKSGAPKLIDFGAACMADDPKRGPGTEGYEAPEQARGKAGLKSDVYSAGKMLAHSLPGKKGLLDPKYLNRELLDADVPVEALVLSMTQDDPDQRPSAMEALNAPWFADAKGDVDGQKIIMSLLQAKKDGGHKQ
jgi:serine/threonine protein kinase